MTCIMMGIYRQIIENRCFRHAAGRRFCFLNTTGRGIFMFNIKSNIGKLILSLILTLLLCSCGGGDDSGDAIILDKDTVNLNMESLGRLPVDSIVVSSDDSDVEKYSFEFIDGDPSEWLDAHLGSYNDILLGATANDLPLGHYEITMRVLVANGNDSVLASQDVKITLNVVDEFIVSTVPDSLTFSGPANTALPEQTVTFDSNTGTYPRIWSSSNKIDWLNVTNAEDYRSVTVAVIPQPAGTYDAEVSLLYYFNGEPREVKFPVVYYSQQPR